MTEPLAAPTQTIVAAVRDAASEPLSSGRAEIEVRRIDTGFEPLDIVDLVPNNSDAARVSVQVDHELSVTMYLGHHCVSTEFGNQNPAELAREVGVIVGSLVRGEFEDWRSSDRLGAGELGIIGSGENKRLFKNNSLTPQRRIRSRWRHSTYAAY